MTTVYDPWGGFQTKTWARKRAPKLNGYCYLQYLRPKYRWAACCALRFERNPTAAQVWGLRKWFHNYVDHYEITQTTPQLVHLRRHDTANTGYFDRTFSLKIGRVGSEASYPEPRPSNIKLRHIRSNDPTFPEGEVVIGTTTRHDQLTNEEEQILSQILHTTTLDSWRDHEIDKGITEFLSEFYSTPYFEEKQRYQEDEPIRMYLQRHLENHEWMVPATASLTREHRQRAAISTLVAHQALLTQFGQWQECVEALRLEQQERQDAEKETFRIRRESTENAQTVVTQRQQITQHQHTIALRTTERNDAITSLNNIRARKEEMDTWMQDKLHSPFTKESIEGYLKQYISGFTDIDPEPLDFRQVQGVLSTVREEFSDIRAELDQYQIEIGRAFPTEQILDIHDVANEIQRIRARADQTPLWALISDHPQRKRPTTPKDLANQIMTHYMNKFLRIWDAIPLSARQASGSISPVSNINEAISRLSSGVNRLSADYSSLEQNMATTAQEAINHIWGLIPDNNKLNNDGTPMQPTADNIASIINDLNNALGCDHPHQLDIAIGQNVSLPDREWATMINHVRNQNMNPPGPPPQGPLPAPPGGPPAPPVVAPIVPAPVPQWKPLGLLPTFDGNSENLRMWKASARNYATLNQNAPGDQFAAMVFASLEGPAAVWATQTTGNRYSRAGGAPLNAQLTLEGILLALDQEFSDASMEQAYKNKLHTLQQKWNTPMTEHIEKFRRYVINAGKDVNEEEERFIGSCYWDVRQMLENHKLLEKARGNIMTFSEIIHWAQIYHAQKAGHRKEPTSRGGNTTPRNASTPQTSNTPTQAKWKPDCNHPNWQNCPQILKGYLGRAGTPERDWKEQQLRAQGICVKCRGELQPNEPGYVANKPPVPTAWPQGMQQPVRGQ
ncbi:hypothetical protein GGI35DRAFT_403851 [Trichoderma velutinum]